MKKPPANKKLINILIDVVVVGVLFLCLLKINIDDVDGRNDALFIVVVVGGDDENDDDDEDTPSLSPVVDSNSVSVSVLLLLLLLLLLLPLSKNDDDDINVVLTIVGILVVQHPS